MPGGDRTGPLGLGPRTGRGAGYCAGSALPGYANPWPAGGYWGFGRGGGRGHRHMYYATGLPYWARFTGAAFAPHEPESELQILREQADYFQNMLKNIQDRMNDIEAKLEKK